MRSELNFLPAHVAADVFCREIKGFGDQTILTMDTKGGPDGLVVSHSADDADGLGFSSQGHLRFSSLTSTAVRQAMLTARGLYGCYKV